MKFSVSIQGTLCQNCFPAHCKCIKFSLDGAGFFVLPIRACRIFVFKITQPQSLFQTPKYMYHLKNQFYQQYMIESSDSHSKELLSLIFSKHFIKNTTRPTEATLWEWEWGLKQRCFWAPDGKWKWCCPIFQANCLH